MWQSKLFDDLPLEKFFGGKRLRANYMEENFDVEIPERVKEVKECY